MNKLFRLYNQNRFTIWIFIIIIIFGFTIIQIFNSSARENRIIENEKYANKISNNINVGNAINSYDKQSQSMVSGGMVDEQFKSKFGNLIDSFFNYCIQENYEKAYELVSNDCKKELYPTIDTFIKLYCKNKFDKNKKFSFQSWTTTNAYVYRVKIFDDMLSTGKISSDDYIEEYVSVIEEDGYKLSINGYVGKVKINKKVDNQYLSMKIIESNVYMDYSTYKILVKNNSDNEILLDSQRNDNTVYLLDNSNVNYYAFLYELNEEDLIVDSGESKIVEIKFNNAYRENININQIIFSDIILNNQEFMNNKDNYNKILDLQIGI